MGTMLVTADVTTHRPSPQDVDGLVGWYDFGDITTMFQDTASTTPVTTDGQTIGSILDKSGNGRTLTQSTAGSRPTYKTNILNSRSVGRFDGGDWLTSAAFTVSIPSAAFIVGTNTDLGTDSWAFSGQNATGGGFIIYRSSADQWTLYNGTNMAYTATGADASAHIFVAVCNGVASKLYVGGGTPVSGNTGAMDLKAISIGANYNGGSPIVGDVSEVAVYGRVSALSAGELDVVGNYLKRWGLAWAPAV